MFLDITGGQLTDRNTSTHKKGKISCPKRALRAQTTFGSPNRQRKLSGNMVRDPQSGYTRGRCLLVANSPSLFVLAAYIMDPSLGKALLLFAECCAVVKVSCALDFLFRSINSRPNEWDVNSKHISDLLTSIKTICHRQK